MKWRAAELPPPIQMCDALSRNVPKLPRGLELVMANCLAHGRRNFVVVVDNFPMECRYVLETLGEVYGNDEVARERGMTAAERLAYHQERSGPLMEGLRQWGEQQLAEHKIEPNSGLGKAIRYLLKHWEKLTLFLRREGAPLDKGYASYCTSCEPCTTMFGKRRLSDSLVPWALRGGLGPGSSYRNRCLSLTG